MKLLFRIILMKNINHKTKLTLILVTILAFNQALAVKTSGTLKGMTIFPNYVVVKINSPSGSSVTCTPVEGGFGLERSHPMFSEIYSMLLTAKVSDLSIAIEHEAGSRNLCLIQEAEL